MNRFFKYFLLASGLSAEAVCQEINYSVEAFVDRIAATEPTSLLQDQPEIVRYLRVLDGTELNFLKNSFYALHGHRFAKSSLREFFGKWDWYKPRPATSDLSPMEKMNVHYLDSLERSDIRRFAGFLSVFLEKPPPLEIRANILGNEERSLPDSLALADIDAARFIYADELPNDRFQRLTNSCCRFIPQFRITRRGFVMVCYLETTGADGGQDNYILATFDKRGNPISKERIVSSSVSLDMESRGEAKIATDLTVTALDTSIYYREENVESHREAKVSRFRVLSTGVIIVSE